MSRKASLIAIALIVVMMVSLFISCEEADSVPPLSNEEKKVLIEELLNAMNYGMAEAPDSPQDFLLEFTLPDEFSEATYIKNGAEVTIKFTLSSFTFEITATGKSVYGEKATWILAVNAETGDLSEAKLNGAVLDESLFPDFDPAG